MVSKNAEKRLEKITIISQLTVSKIAAKRLVEESQSMIPQEKTFIQWLRFYDRETRLAGNKNMHGLRHAYAQKRYFELTGHKSPICGGPKPASRQEKDLDLFARKTISQELDHARVQITRAYLG